MELLDNLAELARNIVLYPSALSVFALIITSGINELFGIVPYTVLLSSQMALLDVPLSTGLFFKLFVFVAVPAGIGTAFGSLLVYGLGFWGGKPAIDKFGKHLRLSWDSVEKVQSKFQGGLSDEALFLALRSIPFMPGLPISAAAGILQMQLVPYLLLTALGATVKVMIMCALIGIGVEAVAI